MASKIRTATQHAIISLQQTANQNIYMRRRVTIEEFVRMQKELQASLNPVTREILNIYLHSPRAIELSCTMDIAEGGDAPRFTYGTPSFPPEVQATLDKLYAMRRSIVEASGIEQVEVIN